MESSFEGRYVNRAATGKGEQKTFTKEINRVNIGHSSVINIFDTFGIELDDDIFKSDNDVMLTFDTSNYKYCLKDILIGKIGHGFSL